MVECEGLVKVAAAVELAALAVAVADDSTEDV